MNSSTIVEYERTDGTVMLCRNTVPYYCTVMLCHAVPLFISSKILTLQMLYAEKVSSIMFDISCMNAPSNVCDFFTKANSKHKHETRFSSSGNYYVQTSRMNLNQDSFPRFGAKRWNAILNELRQLSKGAFIKKFRETFCSR